MVDKHHCGSFFHRSGLTIRREESLANYARIGPPRECNRDVLFS